MRMVEEGIQQQRSICIIPEIWKKSIIILIPTKYLTQGTYYGVKLYPEIYILHPNPGPSTKYPCPVCARNVTSRGLSNLCNRCSGGYIRSVLVLKTQRSIDELRNGRAALAVPHALYRHYNRFHHQFQYKLSVVIPSPLCNSTQMSSATN